MEHTGENFSLEEDNILRVNSPADRLDGPYVVAHVDEIDRWAVVALDWEESPCLGMRWFWSTSGTPSSRNHGTWLIVPDQLSDGLIQSLLLRPKEIHLLRRFLVGDIVGGELKTQWNALRSED